jgi:hypothetical protein
VLKTEATTTLLCFVTVVLLMRTVASLFQLHGTEKYANLEEEQDFNKKIISRLGTLFKCQYKPDFGV